MALRVLLVSFTAATLAFVVAHSVVLVQFRRLIEGTHLFTIFFEKGWGRSRGHYHLRYLLPPAAPPDKAILTTEQRQLYRAVRAAAIGAIACACFAVIVGVCIAVRSR